MALYKKQVGAALLIAALSTSSLYAVDFDNHWAKEAITTWQGYGIVKGYEDQTFRPSNTITRAEFATMLNRTLNLPKVEGQNSFIDLMLNGDKWYAEAVQNVTLSGFMYIEGMNFMPSQAITRQEAAYALAQAFKLTSTEVATKQYTDADQIATWAAQSVQALTERGYISGNPDGSFRPEGTLTRAEFVTMLHNMAGHLIQTPGTYTESIKGSVLINTKGVTLKNMTIEGDLYLAQGIGSEGITLENVIVKGKLYANSGVLTLGGTFNEVLVASGRAVTLTSGNIKKLVVNEVGTVLTVHKDAAVETLVENKYIDVTGEGTIQGQPITTTGGAGGGGGGIGQGQTIEIASAGIYINQSYVALPVTEGTIELDLADLATRFNLSDTVDGLIIETSVEGATITSRVGTMESGKKYTFEQAEAQLGIIREVALKLGVSPTAVINYIFGVDQLTIGSLLEDFKTGMEQAAEMDITLENQYDFARNIQHTNGGTGSFTITMRIQ